MAFGQFLQRGKQNVSKFLSSTLPSAARSGVRFFNTTVIPGARRLHGVAKAISDEVESNERVSPKMKKNMKKVSNFADLGMKGLEDIQSSTNRVAKNIGLD